jgi:hypothetical protein
MSRPHSVQSVVVVVAFNADFVPSELVPSGLIGKCQPEFGGSAHGQTLRNASERKEKQSKLRKQQTT